MADWTPLGDRAIRFTRPDRSARAIVHAVRAWPGVVDVVVARHDVAAYFDGAPAPDSLGAQIRALAHAPDDPIAPRDITLPARYDGPDLASVAEATKLSVDEV